MNVQINSIPPGSICEGCLSVDRKLSPILDVESRMFFLQTLHSINMSDPLYLCWECKALIKRVLMFKKRIKCAHDCLVRYMHHETTEITTLSQIKHHKITQDHNGFDNISDKSIDKLKTDFDLKSEAGDRNDSCSRKVSCNNFECNDKDKSNENIYEPLFVKMEDDVCDDGFYIDDESQDVADDKMLWKSGQILDENQTVKSKAKTRRKMSQKLDTQEEFNDSDDEPLKLKKDRAEGEEKPGSKRKKRETRGTQKGRRREKPPGVVHNARVEKKLQQLNLTHHQVEMVVLSWEEVEVERQAALQSPAYTSLQYRCSDCVLGFNHSSKLTAHMAKHSPSAGASSCTVCAVRCRNAHALCAHMRRHRVRWRCKACGCAWSRAEVAADHVARAHGSAQPTHTCNICGHSEPTLGKLRNHLKNHAERQRCELCGKTFRDRGSLRTHLFIHTGKKEHTCPQCDKKFLFKKAMELHLVTHDASQHLYCYECDMNFKNRMSYYQHMKYNLKHIDPAKLKYKCGECDKRFAKPARLREHHVAVHLKATPVQCTLSGCSFACASRPVLRTHMRMVHRNLRAVRNHVCHTCGKAYTTKKILEGHLRSHTGERPFRCARCPAAFGYEAALYNHTKLLHQRAKTGRGRPPPNASSEPADPESWSQVQQASNDAQDTGTNS